MFASTLLLALAAASGISAQFTTTVDGDAIPGFDSQSLVLEQKGSGGDETTYIAYAPTDAASEDTGLGGGTVTVVAGASTLSLGLAIQEGSVDMQCDINGDDAVCVEKLVAQGQTQAVTTTLPASQLQQGLLGGATGVASASDDASDSPTSKPTASAVTNAESSTGFTAAVSSVLALGALALSFFL